MHERNDGPLIPRCRLNRDRFFQRVHEHHEREARMPYIKYYIWSMYPNTYAQERKMFHQTGANQLMHTENRNYGFDVEQKKEYTCHPTVSETEEHVT